MPHVNTGGSEDFFSNDEVKVYKDEGEEEKRSSENLSEDKFGLVTETEEGKGGYTGNEKSDRRGEDGKAVQSQGERGDVGPFGYLSDYPYHNGATPTTMGGKMPMLQSPLGVMMGYNNDSPFSSPPPAHMGIPPVTIDPKTGLPRPSMYSYPSPHGQFTPSLYPDVQWQRPPGYPITSGALGGPYPPALLNSPARYPPGLFPPGMHPGMPHPALVGAGPKQEGGVSQQLGQDNHRHGLHDPGSQGNPNQEPPEKKKPHIKKPLNAFMLFMKEQRAKVVAECTLKESAAINQILGRRWHALDRSEQAKYYEMARKEKELHLQLYPGWSARDNYAVHSKKKKRRKDIPSREGEKGTLPSDRYLDNPAFGDCTQTKKCRARFGMEQQKQWCKPCRRKKKCIRAYGDGNGTNTDGEDDYSDSVATGDSFHDSDSMLGSPTPSSHSEDIFSTPNKSLPRTVDSPLAHDMSHDLSDIDMTLKPGDDKYGCGGRSPSLSNTRSERLPLTPFSISALASPVTFNKANVNSSYSIDSLAVSSVAPNAKRRKENDYGVFNLSSPDRFHQHHPSDSLNNFSKDLSEQPQAGISPKSQSTKGNGRTGSFSISALSVSAVTPSRVHVT